MRISDWSSDVCSSDLEGLRIGFGLALQGLQLGELSQSLGGPAFRGTLDGTIPVARYADDRLDFDGGLSMQVFDGRVEIGRGSCREEWVGTCRFRWSRVH